MRRAYKELLLLVFCMLIGLALPALIAFTIGYLPNEHHPMSDDGIIRLYSHEGEGGASSMTMRQLLIGTIAAYNASDTPVESLKAQAVALRSRIFCLLGYCRDEADSLCDSPSHGLAFSDVDTLAALWGRSEAVKRYEVAAEAVDAVKNEVLCHGDQYVLALTHASSPSKTKEMEGYPYLAAVTTPEVGEVSELTLGKREFAEIAAADFGIACPEGDEWSITLTCSENGRVERVRIEEREVSGSDFAEAMGLPSDAFTLSVGDAVRFTCRGVGSGYGLSRAGAALYSEQGLDYREILLHYFPNTELTVV